MALSVFMIKVVMFKASITESLSEYKKKHKPREKLAFVFFWIIQFFLMAFLTLRALNICANRVNRILDF